MKNGRGQILIFARSIPSAENQDLTPLLRILAVVLLMLRATTASAQVALEIKDFVATPMT